MTAPRSRFQSFRGAGNPPHQAELVGLGVIEQGIPRQAANHGTRGKNVEVLKGHGGELRRAGTE